MSLFGLQACFQRRDCPRAVGHALLFRIGRFAECAPAEIVGYEQRIISEAAAAARFEGYLAFAAAFADQRFVPGPQQAHRAH